MTRSKLMGAPPHPPRPSYQVDSERTALRAIAAPDVNVAVWQRRLPVQLVTELDQWAATAPLAFDGVLTAENCDLSQIAPKLSARHAAVLRADVRRLVGLFLELSEVTSFRLSFGAVCGNQCRKFHVDYLWLRLITTYVGPGTEWLPDDAVDRQGLQPSVESAQAANQKVVRYPAEIRRAQAGDVVLLKGAQASRLPAVHRSPTIEGTGITRVVLTLTAHERS